MTVDAKPAHLSMDEIRDMLAAMARDEEGGPDRFRAIRMLTSMDAGSVTLPEPLAPDEIVQRMVRLMKGYGNEIIRVAYRRAFPQARLDVSTVTKIMMDELPAELREKALKIRTVRRLYREFPEIKRGSTPPGYPRGRGVAVQTEWLQRMAARMYLDREQMKANAATAELEAPASEP